VKLPVAGEFVHALIRTKARIVAGGVEVPVAARVRAAAAPAIDNSADSRAQRAIWRMGVFAVRRLAMQEAAGRRSPRARASPRAARKSIAESFSSS